MGQVAGMWEKFRGSKTSAAPLTNAIRGLRDSDRGVAVEEVEEHGKDGLLDLNLWRRKHDTQDFRGSYKATEGGHR